MAVARERFSRGLDRAAGRTAGRTAGRAAGYAAGRALRLAAVPALVALAAASASDPAAFAGGGTRSWWRRNDNVRADAQSARDAASQAFYELDSAQREVRISIEAIGAVDDSADARRALSDFEQLDQRINQISTEYIDALDAHDLDAEDLDTGAAQRARRELEKARDELKRVNKDLDRFNSALAPLISAAEGQLVQVVPAVERAKKTWLAATTAVEDVKSTGLRADDLMARLVALNDDLTMLGEGAGTHGVRATLHRAATVQRAAEAIRNEAQRLPERAKEIDRRVRSLRTRTQAVQTKLGSVQPALSELRRRFNVKCWQDIQQVQGQAEEALRNADTRLSDAAKARDEQRWPDATGALGTVRALLNDADSAAAAPAERLRVLNEVERDPRQGVEKARFAIRDAQRLAMTGRNQPDPKHARPLDDAVSRLERIDSFLEGRHPDYWSYLKELETIQKAAADVVQRIREERAGGGAGGGGGGGGRSR
jgi:chromosome segregation ATPase